ncbi:nucleoside deaminase [Chitinophaga oryziterrae]|uniref:Nucleoside deaminase n=1 Tax=Chitinophaga oryziterrae TaxID=1031224 RepID=A0A6N8JJK2_9BACT|nr:nucleoside deaminase [Chitinophaga oryziterrae]MVT45164.1 nucleoside deaminase [Chitinophaga oryziterrae]
MNKDHEFYMHRCVALGILAGHRGDSPVGSVIVKDGHIIGEGMEGGKTNMDITFHAEIEAIRHATHALKSQDLSDCTLYTTHEPCIMCSYVIRHTRINTVVMGLTTGEIGGYSSLYPILKDTSIKHWDNPPTIITGILEDHCRGLHK